MQPHYIYAFCMLYLTAEFIKIIQPLVCKFYLKYNNLIGQFIFHKPISEKRDTFSAACKSRWILSSSSSYSETSTSPLISQKRLIFISNEMKDK
ncbi:hypothetical protein T4D_1806 [Trichinella pseudospiralis]|uniref:Uncharacterized protein n=1 Tax=Trichinella pseudospiralis TaxID=6337 RepID=A0A0V1FJ78_TRIPS|nr:hypothetical protein T4D_1806 [Trichinella pseudospiralis]